MKFLPYILIALIIGAFVFQQHTISSLSSELGTSKEKIQTLENNQNQIKNDLDEYKKRKDGYEDKVKSLKSDNRKRKDDLNEKKGKEDLISQKPSLVEKQINDSFRKAANELSCNTGATERCD